MHELSVDCPDCKKSVEKSVYRIDDGEHVDMKCGCGCEFYARADVEMSLLVEGVYSHSREAEERIAGEESRKYLDPVTPSLFKDVPPWREVMRDQHAG
jgi:hypothetical protein